jgi:uncharacterized membrane protein
VEIHNTGEATAEDVVVLLKVVRAGGIAVDRSLRHEVGALPPGQRVTVQLDGGELLPSGVGLKDATFVLQAIGEGLRSGEIPQTAPEPDLSIREHQGIPGAPSKIKVGIVNAGSTTAAPSQLLLKVEKYQDIPIRTQLRVPIDAVKAGQISRVVIDAKQILPDGVPLDETQFTLSVDPDNMIRETDENNNTRVNQP